MKWFSKPFSFVGSCQWGVAVSYTNDEKKKSNFETIQSALTGLRKSRNMTWFEKLVDAPIDNIYMEYKMTKVSDFCDKMFKNCW